MTVSNLTAGPGVLYTAAFGATEPALTAVNTTPDTSVWTDVGGTEGGVTLGIKQDFMELTCDQIVDRVGSRLQKREMTLKCNMAEVTLENLALAANGGGTVTSGSGYKTFAPTNDNSVTQPNYRALLFDGWAPGLLKNRRVIARRVLSTAGVDFAYEKSKQTIFTAEFTAHYVSAATPPYVVVDQV